MVASLSGFEQLPGDEWQGLCIRVLREHHGPAHLVHVPDEDRGDAGMEAFSLDGCVYQCYAPENEPLRASQRFTKQRDKMTEDVGKFIDNHDKIKRILPPGFEASLWILLVPLITTKRLMEHASTQTQRLRDADLSYAAANVIVEAQTITAYEQACVTVVTRQLTRLSLPAADQLDYGMLQTPQIETMNTKLAKTPAYQTVESRTTLVDRLLTSHLVGRTHRDCLRDQLSELGDELEERLSDLEARLELHYRLDQPDPDRLLVSVLDDTERKVRDVLNIRDSEARVIAEGQVADWLMRCPLDFP